MAIFDKYLHHKRTTFLIDFCFTTNLTFKTRFEKVCVDYY